MATMIPGLAKLICTAGFTFTVLFGFCQKRVGIGAASPEGTIHIRNSNSLENHLVFEGFSNALNRITVRYELGHFIFQTTEVPGTSWDFRDNAGVTRVALNSTGQVNIGADLLISPSGSIARGTSSPAAPMHLVRNFASGGGYNGNSLMILEDNANSYIQLSHPNNRETGILSGNASTSIRSAIVFQSDSSLSFRAGGNNTKLLIAKNGFVGIGTTPQSALDVNGSVNVSSDLNVNGYVTIGANGTTLNRVIRKSIVHNLPSIPANSSYTDTFDIAGVIPFSSVSISPDAQMHSGLVIAYARVPDDDIVEVRFCNTSNAAIDPFPIYYHITVFR